MQIQPAITWRLIGEGKVIAVLLKLNATGRGGIDRDGSPHTVMVLMHMSGDNRLHLPMGNEHFV